MILLSNQTTNTTSTAVDLKANNQNRAYRVYTYYCTGTMDGCTVKIQISMDNSNFIDAVSITSVGGALIEFTAAYVRATLSSAGATTNVTLRLE